MKKQKLQIKDRVYKLVSSRIPLSFSLKSKSSKARPLLYFDESSNQNRELRYARNQKSCFVDEQDGSAILERIVFEDGMLFVSKTNPVLQQFLSIHPSNGKVFYEVDNEKDAQSEVEVLDVRLDAQIAARDLDVDTLETVARIGLGLNADNMTTAEMKRDVRVYANQYPEDFLEIINDPLLKVQNLVAKLFSNNMIALKNNKKDVYLNLPKNKTKLVTIPFGESPIYTVASFFQTDDGLAVMQMLESKLEE